MTQPRNFIGILLLVLVLSGGCSATKVEHLAVESWDDTNAVGVEVDDIDGKQYYWLYRDKIPELVARIERNTEPSDYSRDMQARGFGIFVFGTSDFKKSGFVILVTLQSTSGVGAKGEQYSSSNPFAPQIKRYEKVKQFVQLHGTAIEKAEFENFAYKEEIENVARFYWRK